MANMNSLNTLLAGVASAETLIEQYRKVCPRALEPNLPGETERDALNYCSGATEFVMGYLTGSGRLYSVAQSMSVRQVLSKKTADDMLKKFAGPGSLKFGLLVNAGGMSHECVFMGSGSQWAFYQANENGSKSQKFTLAPKLNPSGRNWCINNMSATQFAQFFVGLTDAGYSTKLFRRPMDKWSIAGLSAGGQNLLA
jgi:hypothetical protein